MSIKFPILCKFTTSYCNRWKQAQTLLNTVLEVSQFLQIIPEKNCLMDVNKNLTILSRLYLQRKPGQVVQGPGQSSSSGVVTFKQEGIYLCSDLLINETTPTLILHMHRVHVNYKDDAWWKLTCASSKISMKSGQNYKAFWSAIHLPLEHKQSPSRREKNTL